MVRLVIAHRNSLVRDVIRILGAGRNILVVGEADDPGGLTELCLREHPDVVLTEGDYDTCGVESALPGLVATTTKVVVICDDSSPDRLTGILAAGASGWLRHDAGPSDVLDAIDAVADGAAILDPPATKTIIDQWRHLLSFYIAHTGAAPAAGM
jgi:DNA-binding NarL/FixJ family response regulator